MRWAGVDWDGLEWVGAGCGVVVGWRDVIRCPGRLWVVMGSCASTAWGSTSPPLHLQGLKCARSPVLGNVLLTCEGI